MVIKTFLGVKILDKEVYIKYAEGDPGEFHKFLKKYFAAQAIIDLNSLLPCNFSEKTIMALPINFSFLFKL